MRVFHDRTSTFPNSTSPFFTHFPSRFVQFSPLLRNQFWFGPSIIVVLSYEHAWLRDVPLKWLGRVRRNEFIESHSQSTDRALRSIVGVAQGAEVRSCLVLLDLLRFFVTAMSCFPVLCQTLPGCQFRRRLISPRVFIKSGRNFTAET